MTCSMDSGRIFVEVHVPSGLLPSCLFLYYERQDWPLVTQHEACKIKETVKLARREMIGRWSTGRVSHHLADLSSSRREHDQLLE